MPRSSSPSAATETDALGVRALNRALLARQGLLDRWAAPAEAAMARLIGLQSQAPTPPYLGLWTRLEGFRPEELSQAIAERRAVRIALMRSTIHLATMADCLALRPLLQPVLERAFRTGHGKRLAGVDLDAVAAAGRALVEEQPRTFAELGTLLAARWRDRDPADLAAVRTLVPLVQVPPRGLWGQSGPAVHTSAEAWLGQPLDPDPDPETLIRRYLAAFGPASTRDVQIWSGLTGQRAVVDRLRPELVEFRDGAGCELLDLPDAPRPDPTTPAPARFLPEWDNLLLSHDDRARILPEAYRPRVVTVNGIVRATILVDGFVAGTWAIERSRDAVTLVIDAFAPLAAGDRTALAAEAMRLLPFAARDAREHDVRFTGMA